MTTSTTNEMTWYPRGTLQGAGPVGAFHALIVHGATQGTFERLLASLHQAGHVALPGPQTSPGEDRLVSTDATREECRHAATLVGIRMEARS